MNERADITVWGAGLLDRSKLAAVRPDAVFVGTIDDLRQQCRPGTRVIVDLSRPGWEEAVRVARRAGAGVSGYASHVERALLEAARAEGCDAVSRSAFFAGLTGRLA